MSAQLIADGHDRLGARVRWRRKGDRAWESVPLRAGDDDRWTGSISPSAIGLHELVVDAWTDRYATWRHEIEVKAAAGQDVELELEEGARLLEDLADQGLRREGEEAAAGRRRGRAPHELHPRGAARRRPAADDVAELVAGVPDARLSSSAAHPLWVDRPRAGHAAWYELFPRSFGGLKGAIEHLSYVADLGFDVVYLPPIHPIGTTHRKGRGNSLAAGPDDPGSPWAIGGAEGGHDAVHPDLGTIEDFDAFVDAAEDLGLEVALDYALQCSPDHPWVRDHPEWFQQRPDGSIRYAENPPKKYQDIHPIEFWPADDADRVALWEACRDVLEHWIGHGVRTFRVDNPHTKPLAFWEWVIRRRAEPPPRRDLPRRGVHGAGDDGQARRGRLHAELHVLHVAPRAVGAARVRRRAHPARRWSSTCGRRSGPTRPTSSTTTSATRRRARSRCASSSPPRSCRSTASTPATSSARTSRPTTPPPSTATPRSTRSRRATTSRSRRSRRSSAR